ncbi:DUF4397 domain-containing protein [Umezawaea endophytica]|uniref:DUF4397 domain-containing protein n=1 Tax=Umezawaea endophytica TaxID=1654476 RepID=A0A9X2VLP3_9PSEU|nr:DUF4397 domain-containing protein [Umezawaea endophytica]MCS7477488.1 DUF4397 domain-containing protein [Umezawaea endophytica]
MGSIRSARRVSVAVVAAVVGLLAVPLPAQAVGGCYLRLAHLSPDTPAVDVTVTAFSRPDWSVTLKGVAYGALSDYQRIETGTYSVAMRPAGADPASKPVISATIDGADGKAYTVAGLGKFADLSLAVLNDDIGLPPAGQARMRVVNAAPLAGDLAVRRGDESVVEHAVFGRAGDYALVPAGRTVLKLAPQQGANAELPVDLQAGSVYSVLVLEKDGVLSATARQDAKGAEVVPTGGIEAGLGGAQDGLAPPHLALLAVAAAAGGALVLAVRRRRTG